MKRRKLACQRERDSLKTFDDQLSSAQRNAQQHENDKKTLEELVNAKDRDLEDHKRELTKFKEEKRNSLVNDEALRAELDRIHQEKELLH